jgi:hypothetical protein
VSPLNAFPHDPPCSSDGGHHFTNAGRNESSILSSVGTRIQPCVGPSKRLEPFRISGSTDRRQRLSERADGESGRFPEPVAGERGDDRRAGEDEVPLGGVRLKTQERVLLERRIDPFELRRDLRVRGGVGEEKLDPFP